MKPILPVYLNQNNVFDVLAMLNGGLATVTTVTEKDGSNKSSSGELNAGFGLGAAFNSPLKIDVGAKVGGKQGTANEKVRSEERIHTSASLLYRL